MTALRARLRDAVGETVGRGHARERIVAAAVDAFAERGVAATTVEDLLVAADISRRTFYQYFGDKLAVVHAIFDLVTAQLAQTFTAAIARAADPLAAIDEALAIYLELHRTDRDLVRALLDEALRAESPLYPLRMRFRRDIMRGLDAMFVAIAHRKLDPLVAVALVSAVEGVSVDILVTVPTAATLARARAVIAGLISVVFAHAGELPAKKAS